MCKDPTASFQLVSLILQKLHDVFLTESCFLQQYIDRFEFVLERYLPSLFQHMDSLGFEPLYYFQDWVTTLFTYNLTPPCAGLAWDMFLSADVDEAPMLVSLALLASAQPELLALDSLSAFLQHFKGLIREVKEPVLRVNLHKAYKRLVPSVCIPRGGKAGFGLGWVSFGFVVLYITCFMF